MSLKSNIMPSCEIKELPEKVVKASFAGCSIEDRKTFSSSSCILPISIMQKKEHEAHRFMATMKLVNRSFSFCSLLIVDSLYRYTLKIDHPHETEASLLKMAKDAGDSWLNRNEKAYKQLTISHRIIRWDECLNRDDFEEKNIAVDNLYKSDESYKKSIDATAEQYLSRQLNDSANHEILLLKGKQEEEEIKRARVDFTYEHAFNCCVNYLKEECAAMCLYSVPPFKRHEFEVYPTGRAPALAATYERLIKPYHPDTLKPVSIRFKK